VFSLWSELRLLVAELASGFGPNSGEFGYASRLILAKTLVGVLGTRKSNVKLAKMVCLFQESMSDSAEVSRCRSGG
jgi:hypothetical protein